MAEIETCETDAKIQEKTISSQTEDLKKVSENVDGNDVEAPLNNGSIGNHVEDKENIVQASDSVVVDENPISESNEAECGTADEKPECNEADSGNAEETSAMEANEADSGVEEEKPSSEGAEADSGTPEEKPEGNEADSGSTKDSASTENVEKNEDNSGKAESVTSTDAVTKAEESKSNGTADKEEDKSEKKDDGLGSTVAKHYNDTPAGSVELRKESRIFHLRNFNNWTKSVIIFDYLEKIKRRKRVSDDINVLDMACGKGGDLLKWQKGKVDHLIMADIAGTSISHCKERYAKLQKEERNKRYYRERLFSSEFITADCTKESLRDSYRRKDIKLDLCSCQFAFHYSFESYEQADMMLKNACENLRVGGYFIGTTPDSQKLVKHIKDCKADSFGNSVYNIKPENKETFPLFGSKYMFYLEGVVNCPEFMVYFPLLEKMAAKYNMKLVWKKNFHDIFKENERKHAALLAKMSALEQYPAPKDKALTGGSESQYKSAKDYVDKKGNRRVGTLSADEWEVAGLYIAFAFEKMEPPRESRPKEREERKRTRDSRGSGGSSSRSHERRDKHRSDSSSAKKSKKEVETEEVYEIKDEIYEEENDTETSKPSKEDEKSSSKRKSRSEKRSHKSEGGKGSSESKSDEKDDVIEIDMSPEPAKDEDAVEIVSDGDKEVTESEKVEESAEKSQEAETTEESEKSEEPEKTEEPEMTEEPEKTEEAETTEEPAVEATTEKTDESAVEEQTEEKMEE